MIDKVKILVDLWQEKGEDALFQAMGIDWDYVYTYDFYIDQVDSLDDLILTIIQEQAQFQLPTLLERSEIYPMNYRQRKYPSLNDFKLFLERTNYEIVKEFNGYELITNKGIYGMIDSNLIFIEKKQRQTVDN